MVSLGSSEVHYLNDSVEINYVLPCGTVADNIFRVLGQFDFKILLRALYSIQYIIRQRRLTH